MFVIGNVRPLTIEIWGKVFSVSIFFVLKTLVYPGVQLFWTKILVCAVAIFCSLGSPNIFNTRTTEGVILTPFEKESRTNPKSFTVDPLFL